MKVLKENEELKKKMININSQLQQRKDEEVKKKEEEIKIMNKEQIQQKHGKHPQKERAIRKSLKTWRKLREN